MVGGISDLNPEGVLQANDDGPPSSDVALMWQTPAGQGFVRVPPSCWRGAVEGFAFAVVLAYEIYPKQ